MCTRNNNKHWPNSQFKVKDWLGFKWVSQWVKAAHEIRVHISRVWELFRLSFVWKLKKLRGICQLWRICINFTKIHGRIVNFDVEFKLKLSRRERQASTQSTPFSLNALDETRRERRIPWGEGEMRVERQLTWHLFYNESEKEMTWGL